MLYHEAHSYLSQRVRFSPEETDLPELGQRVRNHYFVSERRDVLRFAAKALYEVLPGKDSLTEADAPGAAATRSILMEPDHDISENSAFAFHALHPDSPEDSDRVIVLLHGFNEKGWGKYLPWASFAAEKTGAAVVMFPIAFHMNRAPAPWSDSHLMRLVSQLRKKEFPDIVHSTLSNAAISVRMSANPGRFFWSGLQSFYDVNQLLRSIRGGGLPGVRRGAAVDFLTYSIGSLLGEVVMMANAGGLCGESRMAAFCGGPVFSRLSPSSKFILDSEGSVALHSFFVEHLESHVKKDPNLASFLGKGGPPEGQIFRSLIDYRLERALREEKFRELAPRLYAVALERDMVVPPCEVVNTLQGARRDVPVRVDVLDPPYPYRHEDPFPAASKDAEAVDGAFRSAFGPICEFLRRPPF